jgi:toxin ParE1/3/4
MPGLGRPRNFPHARLNQLRSFRIKDFENHLIFYSPIQDGVEVFHVLHGARDLAAGIYLDVAAMPYP